MNDTPKNETGSSGDGSPVELLAEEYLERLRRGDHPQVEQYVRDYPELADEIREVFEAVAMLHDCAAGEAEGGAVGEAATAMEAPRQIGDYRIVRELGRGGMGVVYEAEHIPMRRRVALKVLARVGGGHDLERFLREARAAGRLHHTNIVPVFEVGSEGGRHFYAMQRIRGHNLDDVIDDLRRMRANSDITTRRGYPSRSAAVRLHTGEFERAKIDEMLDEEVPANSADTQNVDAAGTRVDLSSGSLSGVGNRKEGYFHRVARIGLQVADALAHAHDQGILHRDIKPSNLILDTTGTVWITDFGLARSEDDGLTHTGDIVGTIRYMAPERFQGEADCRSDIYSLGLTLYELCTFRCAFDQDSRGELIRQVIREQPLRPSKVNPEVPRDLETIVLKSIARAPGERYSSAAKLADDLRLFLGDRPIQARRTSAIEHSWRWCRRNPSVAAMMLCIVVLIGVGFVRTQQYAADLLIKTRAATAAEQRAISAARDERIARENADLYLYQAYFQRAQAERRNALTGRRAESLEALRKAARLVETLDLTTEELEFERLQLRNEMIAVLTKTDLSVDPTLRQDIVSGTICYDSDYRRYAISRGHIEIRNAADHELLAKVPQLKLRATDLLFSDDGRFLGSIHRDSTRVGRWVRVWDLDQGVAVLETATDAAAIRFSAGRTTVENQNETGPDGSDLPLFAFSSQDSMVTVHDLNNPSDIRSHDFGFAVRDFQFSGDGRQVAVAGEQDSIEIWSWETDAVEKIPMREACGTVDWCAKTNQLVVGSLRGTIHIIDMDRGATRVELLGHTDAVRQLSMSRDGEMLASVAWDGTARLWDVSSKQPFKLMENTRLCSGFSQDGRHISYIDADSRITVYQVERNRYKHQYFVDRYLPRRNDISFHPEFSNMAAVATSDHVELWDLQRHQVLHHLRCRRTFVGRFSDDGRRLVSSGRGGLRMWDLTFDDDDWQSISGKESFLVSGFDTEQIAATPDLTQIAFVHKVEGTGFVIQADAPDERIPLEARSLIWRVAMSPDGRWVAATPRSGSGVEIFEASSGRPVTRLASTNRVIPTFSPDGKWLAACGSDRHFLWKVGTWDIVHSLDHASRAPAQICFSPDGKTIAFSLANSTVQLVDRETFQTLAILGLGQRWIVFGVGFSADGRQLGVTMRDRFEVWKLADLRRQLDPLGLDW